MSPAVDRVEARLIELEIKSSFAEDLLDDLNALVARQQERLDRLEREVAALRQQMPSETGAEPRNLRDVLPPHY